MKFLLAVLPIAIVATVVALWPRHHSPAAVASAYVASQPQAVAAAAWFAWSSMDCDGDYEPSESCNDEMQSVNLPPRVISVTKLASGNTRVIVDVLQTTGVPMRFTVLVSPRGGIIGGS